MRRIRSVGEAAVPDWVQREARKFVYPDFDTIGATAQPGGGGGAPTVVLAASDATDISKRKADIVSVGGSAAFGAGEFNQALALMPNGGRLLLTEGTFNVQVSDIVMNVFTAYHIQGVGEATVITTDSTFGGTLITLENHSKISDLTIDGSSHSGGTLVGVTTTNWAKVVNVHFNDFTGTDQAIRGSGNNVLISGCTQEGGGGVFYQSASGNTGVVIVGNSVAGGVILGTGVATSVQQSVVASNYIDGDITGSFTTQMVIAGNYIDGRIGLSGSTGQQTELLIAGNAIANATGSAITLTSMLDSSIIGNIIEASTEHGILLTDCDRILVHDNGIRSSGGGTTNTFDGIHLAGTSSRNSIMGNSIHPRQAGNTTRYGINVAAANCACNIVVGNDLGPLAPYGTDALNDAGTDTQLFYPNDPTYGDNFTDCPTSPSSP